MTEHTTYVNDGSSNVLIGIILAVLLAAWLYFFVIRNDMGTVPNDSTTNTVNLEVKGTLPNTSNDGGTSTATTP